MLVALLLALAQSPQPTAPTPPPPPPSSTPGPEVAPVPPPPPPSAAEPGPQARSLYGLAITGVVVTYAGWLSSIIGWFASIDCHDRGFFDFKCSSSSAWLLFPIFGPWLALLTGGAKGDWVAGSVALGAIQLVGIASMIAGFVIKVPVPAEPVALGIVPTGNGLALSGRF
ncbi:MAG: hypothetical protein IPJ65_11925 [Archangiaceae bacterium]|nr:hypothetical protein [Archangiaceae bacterium]